jgi:hypothetical protein
MGLFIRGALAFILPLVLAATPCFADVEMFRNPGLQLDPLFLPQSGDVMRHPSSLPRKPGGTPKMELLVRSGKKETVFQIVQQGRFYQVHFFNNTGVERMAMLSARDFESLNDKARIFKGIAGKSSECSENKISITMAEPYKHTVSACLNTNSLLKGDLVKVANYLAASLEHRRSL